MDTPITRAEHEEFRRTVNAEIDKLTAEDSRLNKRIIDLESDNHQINVLTVSVQKLTDSIEHMRQLQEDTTKRLSDIESRDGQRWRKVVEYTITAAIGIVVGYLFSLIGI